MKKYVKFNKEKILIVNKNYRLSRFFNPKKINKDLLIQYDKMWHQAQEDKINLNIVSGYRSYKYQQKLLKEYLHVDNIENIKKYLAMPGHSEHQTGLAIDLVNTESKLLRKYTKEYKWLYHNSYKYGFILRYPKGKELITGYKYEPWHFRYVGKNLAKELYNNGDYLTLEEYFHLNNKKR